MLNSLAIEVLFLFRFDDRVQSIPISVSGPLVDLASFAINEQPLSWCFGVHRHDDSSRMLLVVVGFAITRYVVKQVRTVLYLSRAS